MDRLQQTHVGARRDLEVSRHVMRGKVHYVVRDPITYESHRFSAADYQILANLSDQQPLGVLFDQMVSRGILDKSAESSFYRFILDMYRLGLLTLPINDGKQLYSRYLAREEKSRQRSLLSLLFLRVPLSNPDAFLDRTIHLFRIFFSPVGFGLWLLLMLGCAAVLYVRWSDFVNPLNNVLALQNIWFLWGCLLVLKFFHEFGHAYACKRFGGSVTEMGAYFICFNPCAYVDASAAWGFASTRQRIIVSLGGMYFESMVAAVALFVWNFTGPSLINSCAYYAVITASIVTVLFNVNPLMKYDGYYVLCDLAGIPNLRQRSMQYLQSLGKRWLFGVRDAMGPRELSTQLLFFAYGVGSALYRMVVVLAISAAIASKFLIPGLLLGAYYLVTTVGGMLLRVCRYLWLSEELGSQRWRAQLVSLLLLLGIPSAVMLVPIPGHVRARGSIGSEHEHLIRPTVDGILHDVLVEPGSEVAANQPLFEIENLDIRARLAEDTAELQRTIQQFYIQQKDDRILAAQTRQRIAFLETAVAKSRREDAMLRQTAGHDGLVVQVLSPRIHGTFLTKDQPVATLVAGRRVVRVLINSESLADALPRVGQAVVCRVHAFAGEVLAGTILKIAPSGNKRIQNAALTQVGGGDIAVDAASQQAWEEYFEITVVLDHDDDRLLHGMTADVMLGQHHETLAAFVHRRFLNFLNELSQKS